MKILLTNYQKIYISSLVALLLVFFIVAAFFIYRKWWSKKHYKEATYIKLYNLAEGRDYLLLNNYKVDFDDSHIGVIDHLLISRKYIFVINDFSLSGVVQGELQGRSLKNINFKNNVSEISNPLNFNINLVKRFNIYNNVDQSLVKGIVVVENNTHIDIQNESNQFFMVRRKDLKKLILKFEKDKVSKLNEEMTLNFIKRLDGENDGK